MPRQVVYVTTNASGAATEYTDLPVDGFIEHIRYVKTDFDDGSTMTITGESSGTSIWTEAAVNASASRYPRAGTCTTAGAASLYAAGGTAVNDRIYIGDERVKIVVASGGNTKSGEYHITYSK